MWFYAQTSGKLMQDTNYIGTGYSGIGTGLNDPAMQAVPDVGPIPQGAYRIGDPIDTVSHGPFVLPLTPDDSTNTWGRSGFLMHGDEVENAGLHLASHGCIIMARFIRNLVATSGDKDLTVTA